MAQHTPYKWWSHLVSLRHNMHNILAIYYANKVTLLHLNCYRANIFMPCVYTCKIRRDLARLKVLERPAKEVREGKKSVRAAARGRKNAWNDTEDLIDSDQLHGLSDLKCRENLPMNWHIKITSLSQNIIPQGGSIYLVLKFLDKLCFKKCYVFIYSDHFQGYTTSWKCVDIFVRKNTSREI